jgi:hypothetical protein
MQRLINSAKQYPATITLVATLLLCAAAYRYWQVLPYPMGGGRQKASPDGRFTANASTLTDRFFFGGESTYYELTIEEGPHNAVVRRFVIDTPADEMISWRHEGTIQWAPDSSAASFAFGHSTLALSARP